MAKKILQGEVISDKMKKTLVVKVTRIKQHPKYKKRYKVSNNYKAHFEKGDYKVGDRINIEECRPLSKDKRWIVKKKV